MNSIKCKGVQKLNKAKIWSALIHQLKMLKNMKLTLLTVEIRTLKISKRVPSNELYTTILTNYKSLDSMYVKVDQYSSC